MDPRDPTLVFAVVDKRYTEQVMRAATGAGATGATHWRARGTGDDPFTMFDAIFHAEPDREVIGVVVPAAIADDVVDAVLEIVPVDTPGNGFVATLPLDRVAGIANVRGHRPERAAS